MSGRRTVGGCPRRRHRPCHHAGDVDGGSTACGSP